MPRLAKENLIPDAMDNLPKRERYDLDQLELTLNKISPKTTAVPHQGAEVRENADTNTGNTPTSQPAAQAEAAVDLTINDLDDRPIFDEPQRLATLGSALSNVRCQCCACLGGGYRSFGFEATGTD